MGLAQASTNFLKSLHNNSMSQDYHHHHQQHQGGIFSFSNGFDRSDSLTTTQQKQEHQRVEEMNKESSVAGDGIPVYETAGMLSEMFNFPGGEGDLGHGQSFQSNRQLLEQQHQNIPAMNATDSAAAMQLFLMNPPPQPQQPPSPASTTTTRNHQHNSSTLHMLLPNPSHHQNYNNMSMHQVPHQQLTWQSSSPSDHHHHNSQTGGGQGLSLSLSSSLEAAAKAEEYRNIYYGSNSSNESTHHQYNQFKTLLANSSQQHHHHHQVLNQFQSSPATVASSSSSIGAISALRNSRYTTATQELLEEFCSVGRGYLKKNKPRNSSNPNTSGGGDGSPSSAGAIKDHPPLSASDRIEHQRRKVKLLTMLEEVC